MPVVVDYHICDGVEDCSAVRICDANALYFNRETRKVEYDLERCRDCGSCAHYCGPGAVMHAETEEEWEQLKILLQGDEG